MNNLACILFTSILIGFTSGCSNTPRTPEFTNLKNVKIVSANLNKMIVSGEAVFTNPNALSGKLTKMDINIKVSDVNITNIKQDVSISVPKNSDFNVPVNFSFHPQQLTTENNAFLKNALKSLANNSLTIEYSGYVTVEVLGISFDVPVEYTEKVSVGLNYD